MKLSNFTKRSLASFRGVLCGIGFLKCKAKEPSQADQDSITRAEQREADFMQRRAEYIKEYGHVPPSEMERGSTLIQK